MAYSVAAMPSDPTLYDADGSRKYLNEVERRRLQRVMENLIDPLERALCLTLLHTGCRISEALNLKARHVDAIDQVIVLQTLKQRRKRKYRGVPVRKELLQELANLMDERCINPDEQVFPFHRATVWRLIKKCMHEAGLSGSKATIRGLRHTFATTCISRGVPLNKVQKWLGHTKAENTSIYLDFVGADERKWAQRLWD